MEATEGNTKEEQLARQYKIRFRPSCEPKTLRSSSGTRTRFDERSERVVAVAGVSFLDFMTELVSKYPGKELHVVLDNLNTHKPKEDRWLRAQ